MTDDLTHIPKEPMDRKKQIEEAARNAENYGLNSGDSFRGVPKGIQSTFSQGAQWADANPLNKNTHPPGLGVSRDDERDAEQYVQESGTKEEWTFYSADIREAFLAGRKGMVPASEVERLKGEIKTAYKMARDALHTANIRDSEVIQVYGRELIEEAVKAERERRCKCSSCESHDELLNPTEAKAE